MRKVTKSWKRARTRRSSYELGERWPEMRQKHGITTAFIKASRPEATGIGASGRSAVE